ncbi:MAG: hypothetical protein MR332_13245 [Fusicatenibacter sp.]|nr:hypothetical protein [Fusicatenibacter sp.]
MLNLTEEQIIFIKENFKEEDAKKMLETADVNDILLPLDALITYQGFDDDYLLNRWGNKAQRIYDEIYTQNE